nr:hypothetical protein [Tanacetum cinerariifolium]
MFLNVEQLEKQLDKEDFQEIGSMDAFNYTQLAILEFYDTLIQHMESVKKLIDERAQHKREYDSWVKERPMQTSEEKVDMSKALDAEGFKEFSTEEQAMTSDHNSSELGIHDYNNKQSSSKLVSKVVPRVEKTATSRQKLELLFHHHITIL